MSSQQGQRQVNILFTTDVHGNYFPFPFRHGCKGKGSLQRVHAFVAREVGRLQGATILVDGGDLLQGGAAAYYLNFIASQRKGHRVADYCNFIGYDVGVLGNHDIEMGHEVVARFIRSCHFPILGANVIDERTGDCALDPYVIIHRGGVRVAFVGFVTPAIPHWVPKALWEGLRFEDITECARRTIAGLRHSEQPDCVVALMHSGMDEGIITPQYRENAVRQTVEQVEGIDLVLYGHDHCPHIEEVTSPSGRNILCINPGSEAYNLAKVNVEISADGSVSTRGCNCYIGRIGGAHAQAFNRHFRSDYNTILAWSKQRVGTILSPLDVSQAYFGPSAYIDFIQRLQLDISGADIAFSAPLFFNAQIAAGDVSMGDLFNIYRFEDRLYTLLLSGQEIKDYLEMSYAQWTNTMSSPDDHLLLLSPLKNNPSRLGFANFNFNFDAAAGLRYEVDVTRPPGHKLCIHSLTSGQPFRTDATYRVAMTAYRANGGGELLTRGASIAKEDIPGRILCCSLHDMRHYIMEYLRQNQSVTPEPLNNWRFIPDEWATAAAARDRDILFNH